VISLVPRPGYEVVTSEHRRHSARTGEGPAVSSYRYKNKKNDS